MLTKYLSYTNKVTPHVKLIWSSYIVLGYFRGLEFELRALLSYIFNKDHITYLGNPFYFDKRLQPFTLPTFIKQIEILDSKVDFNEMQYVLDIGANVGQFAYTLKVLFKHLKIYSFEPNKDIYSLLKTNSKKFEDWYIFNYGVGGTSKESDFYYIPGNSGQGSVYEFWAKHNLSGEVKKTSVSLTDLSPEFLKEMSIPRRFGLIKIDVEGYEQETLKGLSNLYSDYIQIELQDNTMTNIRKIMDSIENMWNAKCVIVHNADPATTCDDLIIKVIKN